MNPREGGYPEQEMVRIALQSRLEVVGSVAGLGRELGVDPRVVRRWMRSKEHIPDDVCIHLGFRVRKVPTQRVFIIQTSIYEAV